MKYGKNLFIKILNSLHLIIAVSKKEVRQLKRDYRLLFKIAFVFGILAVVAFFFVKDTKKETTETGELIEQLEFIDDWKQNLLNILFSISPSAFERLTQRMLRESGFTQVEVTGKAGDGGIDGKGIVRVSGLLSFHVIFQCKRYKGTIKPSQIRDFRGAMQGRADKGLFITTGSFTREAIRESTRDGAPPIDLIDGEIFCDKLKELNLGVTTKQIENIEIDSNWFTNL